MCFSESANFKNSKSSRVDSNVVIHSAGRPTSCFNMNIPVIEILGVRFHARKTSAYCYISDNRVIKKMLVNLNPAVINSFENLKKHEPVV